ncbi:hypothetical protein BEI59_03325 [Eisenbergiella tayi]|uniref:Uncharacterized protein n=1 Tax=Eisenbergiella tayi TaxID=1432052 RepID=A0A1E3UMR5_9FIRM|nr:hypothetical protein BEI63_28965 [Eisenbergiella tayi]ODR54972.1 hypothetical protein BEI59_03325 [Eisenbergiella tayi]ODR60677.1 hypothetical protein BEI64_10215 [Eisenbergiella tayi]
MVHTEILLPANASGYADRRTENNQQYLSLKDEVKQAERIRKSVASILRQEKREQQPHKTQDMDK